MSAFIVDRETIDIIATAAIADQDMPAIVRVAAASALGQALWLANVRGVASRYPNDLDRQRPGPVGFRDADAAGYTWTERTADPQDLVDACCTLGYQCSESPDWDGSDEQTVVESVRHLAQQRVDELAEQVAAARKSVPHIDYDVKQTAAELRKALRQRFPGARFSVRMDRGTAYGWLAVSWTDGPADRDVRGVCVEFESERFDGMDDSYHRVEPTLYMVDGVPTEIRYSSCGINTQRTLSAEAVAWGAEQHRANPNAYPSRYPGETTDYQAAWLVCMDLDLTGAMSQ